MLSRIELYPKAIWPSGDCVPLAVLRRSVADLEAALDTHFIPDRDDLDEFLQCGMRLPSGRLLLLLRYVHSPNPGVDVYVDKGDDLAAALSEILDALHLSERDLTWVSPRVDEQGPYNE